MTKTTEAKIMGDKSGNCQRFVEKIKKQAQQELFNDIKVWLIAFLREMNHPEKFHILREFEKKFKLK